MSGNRVAKRVAKRVGKRMGWKCRLLACSVLAGPFIATPLLGQPVLLPQGGRVVAGDATIGPGLSPVK